MDKFNILCNLMKQANLLIEQIDLDTIINNLNINIENITKENILLKEQVYSLNKQIKELNFKYDKDMELISNELKNNQEELSSLTKVSYIQSLNKQLGEKTNYCQILVSQLDKLKRENNQHIINKKEEYSEIKVLNKTNNQTNIIVNNQTNNQSDIIVNNQTNIQTNIQNNQSDIIVNKTLNTNEKEKYSEINVMNKTNNQSDIIVDKTLNTNENNVEHIESTQVKNKKSKKKIEDNINIIENNEQNKLIIESDSIEQNKKSKNKKQIIIEDELEQQVIDFDPQKKSKKSKIVKEQLVEQESIFNPDNFENINGFELLMYKSNYYLRDLETSELYDINKNVPGKIVGLINGKGKIKLQ